MVLNCVSWGTGNDAAAGAAAVWVFSEMVIVLGTRSGWLWLLLGFVFFRLFDIAKPWPIGWLDRRVSGGFGIMIDDVLAGVYAWLVLFLLAKIL